MAIKYWLFKSEPDVYSIDDLRREKKKTAGWDGIRNYQARNLLRDEVKKGDGVLFYHSNAKPPGIAGTAVVVREAYPDPTAFDPSEKYYDPKSDPDNPRWYAVDVRFEQAFAELQSLDSLREVAALKDMVLLRKGMRLSVQPVTRKEWNAILKRAAGKPAAARRRAKRD